MSEMLVSVGKGAEETQLPTKEGEGEKRERREAKNKETPNRPKKEETPEHCSNLIKGQKEVQSTQQQQKERKEKTNYKGQGGSVQRNCSGHIHDPECVSACALEQHHLSFIPSPPPSPPQGPAHHILPYYFQTTSTREETPRRSADLYMRHSRMLRR